MLEGLAHVRDKVLDRTWLAPGETLLDAGSGEGLIGFGGLERGAGHVVFADISQDLLELCRVAADGLGCPSAAASCMRRSRTSTESTETRWMSPARGRS